MCADTQNAKIRSDLDVDVGYFHVHKDVLMESKLKPEIHLVCTWPSLAVIVQSFSCASILTDSHYMRSGVYFFLSSAVRTLWVVGS